MALRIICMCGYVIQGDDEDELWRNAQRHMGVLHPELVGNVTREDILAQASSSSCRRSPAVVGRRHASRTQIATSAVVSVMTAAEASPTTGA
jgi:predicted small metal-binding protein